MYQVQRFHSFLWASGGCFSDFLIHNIDECCWMKDAWPVKAQASGGRHYRGRLHRPELRPLLGRVHLCRRRPSSISKGETSTAAISSSPATLTAPRARRSSPRTLTHPAKCRIYKGHNFTSRRARLAIPAARADPYQLEWDHLIDAIRNDKPYNEVRRGAEASLVTVMGRMAAHTGQLITWDKALNHEHEFAPDVDKLTLDGPAPLRADDERQIPGAAPRHQDETRVLMSFAKRWRFRGV